MSGVALRARPDAALQRRTTDVGGKVLEVVAPVALALLVGALVLLATGASPLGVYRLLAVEAFGTTGRIASTLSSTTPVLFTGLATAIAFRAGVFNVGVEGSLYAGALACAIVGFTLISLPGLLLIPLALAAAAAGGTLMILGPAVARARWGVDEVVTTLMINFIAIGLTAFLVNTYFLAPGMANSVSPLIAAQARLPRLLPPSPLHLGLVLGLVLTVAYGLWIRRTSFGYELRLVGLNPRFSFAHGMPVSRVVLTAMLVSGAVGGVGGGVHVLGLMHRFIADFSPGYGFTGIAVALLARNSAIGVPLAALLFGALASAGTTVQLFADIPLDLVNVLQGTIMIFAVVQLARMRLPRRRAAR